MYIAPRSDGGGYPEVHTLRLDYCGGFPNQVYSLSDFLFFLFP